EVFSRDGAAYVGLDAEVFDQLSRGGADPDRAAHGGTKVGTLGKQTEPSMIGFVRGEELQQAMRPHVGAAGAGRGVDPDDGADGVVLEAGGEHIGSAVAETIDDQNLGALILLSAPVAVLGPRDGEPERVGGAARGGALHGPQPWPQRQPAQARRLAVVAAQAQRRRRVD